MSIAFAAALPARRTLLAEGIEVLDLDQLRARCRRPLRLCLVNLMPTKAATETQITRLLGATSIPVELTLCLPDGYRSRSTPVDHIALYRLWTDLRDEPFDALIVTGAPIEALAFEDVAYWAGLCDIFDWARARRIAGFYICWAAQAALFHFHGVPKHLLRQKIFGVFRQRVANAGSPLLRGFDEEFPAPVSRHTEIHVGDLPVGAGLALLAASPDSGLCLMEDRANRALYMFNHLEYDSGTLRDEFLRDRQLDQAAAIPRNYFPGDDPELAPADVWRPHGHLLFANWLGEICRALGLRYPPFEAPRDGSWAGLALHQRLLRNSSIAAGEALAYKARKLPSSRHSDPDWPPFGPSGVPPGARATAKRVNPTRDSVSAGSIQGEAPRPQEQTRMIAGRGFGSCRPVSRQRRS